MGSWVMICHEKAWLPVYMPLYYKLTGADDPSCLGLVTWNVAPGAPSLEGALHEALLVSPTLDLVEDVGPCGRAKTRDVGGFFSSKGS